MSILYLADRLDSKPCGFGQLCLTEAQVLTPAADISANYLIGLCDFFISVFH